MDIKLIAGFLQRRRPFKWDRRILIYLIDTFLPLRLVRQPFSNGLKAIIGNDLRCAEILELGRIGTSQFSQANQFDSSFQVTIVVRGYIGNEIGWML